MIFNNTDGSEKRGSGSGQWRESFALDDPNFRGRGQKCLPHVRQSRKDDVGQLGQVHVAMGGDEAGIPWK